MTVDAITALLTTGQTLGLIASIGGIVAGASATAYFAARQRALMEKIRFESKRNAVWNVEAADTIRLKGHEGITLYYMGDDGLLHPAEAAPTAQPATKYSPEGRAPSASAEEYPE